MIRRGGGSGGFAFDFDDIQADEALEALGVVPDSFGDPFFTDWADGGYGDVHAGDGKPRAGGEGIGCWGGAE